MDSENQYLSLADIEAAPDVEEQDVEVPEWNGRIRIRGFTKDVEMACREEARDEQGDVDRNELELLFLVHGIIQPRIDSSAAAVLRKKSSAACNRVLRAIMKLSGLDEESQKRRERDFREGLDTPVRLHPDGEAADPDASAVAPTA